MSLSQEELEYYDTLTRTQKSAFTKKRKYSDEERAEWGRKGGLAKVPKGFAVRKDIAREMAQRNKDKRMQRRGIQ